MDKKPELNRRHTLADDYRRITGITPTHGVEFDLVRLMYASYIHVEYTYSYPVISEYPFNLTLNVVYVLLSKVAGLVDVIIIVFRIAIGRYKKAEGIIRRIGSDKGGGEWRIIN